MASRLLGDLRISCEVLVGYVFNMPWPGQSEVGELKLLIRFPRLDSSGVEKLLSEAEDCQGEASLGARRPGLLLSGIVKLGKS